VSWVQSGERPLPECEQSLVDCKGGWFPGTRTCAMPRAGQDWSLRDVVNAGVREMFPTYPPQRLRPYQVFCYVLLVGRLRAHCLGNEEDAPPDHG
jgi:hypothetical protein